MANQNRGGGTKRKASVSFDVRATSLPPSCPKTISFDGTSRVRKCCAHPSPGLKNLFLFFPLILLVFPTTAQSWRAYALTCILVHMFGALSTFVPRNSLIRCCNSLLALCNVFFFGIECGFRHATWSRCRCRGWFSDCCTQTAPDGSGVIQV